MYKYFFSNNSQPSVILNVVYGDEPCVQIFDFNKSFLNILGLSDHEVRNSKISQIIPGFDDIQYSVFEGDNSKQYLKYYSAVNHEDYIVELTVYEGKILLLFKEMRDPELAVLKLKDSENTFRNVFDNVADAIYVQNDKGEFIDVNHGVLTMYGYQKHELIGKTPEMVSAPDKNNLDNIFELFLKAFRGEPQKFEFWGKRKNGEIFPKLVRLSSGYYFGRKVVYAYAIDISEQKLKEEDLKYSLNFQRLVSHISSNFIGLYDIDKSINNLLKAIGLFSQASRSYVFLINESKDVLVNSFRWCKYASDCEDNYLKELPLKALSYWNKELQNGECIFVEDSSLLPSIAIKDDLLKYGVKSIVAVPLMNDNKFMGLVGFDNIEHFGTWKNNVINLLTVSSKIIENVIRRDNAEKQLKYSEEYNKILFQRSTIPLIVMQADTYEYVLCNDAAVEIYGFNSRDELIGLTPIDVSYKTQYNGEDSASLAKKKIDEAVDKGAAIFNWKHQRPNGVVWDAQVHLMYIAYKNEKILQFSLLDITEQRKIMLQNKRLSVAVEQSANTIVITDLEGNIEYVNPVFTEKTGYTAEEAMGKNPRILNSGLQSKEYYENLWNTIKSGSIWEGEFCNKTKSNELFWESATITPLVDSRGVAYAYLAIKEDITRRKEVEEKLKENEKELRIANASKDKFFSIIAHDLINPIGNIKNFSELLKFNFDELDIEKQLKYINIIADSSIHTLNLLQDLLEWSRIQNNQITFNPEVINLAEVVDDCFNLLNSSAMAKNTLLISHIKEDTQVFADKYTVNTVFRNLISNAIKFTEKGTISIASKSINEFEEIVVSDTGVGIPSDKLDKLFKIEENTSTLGTANEKGTGLGLVMCKSFVEGNGGEIKVESELNKGSSFILTLPLLPFD